MLESTAQVATPSPARFVKQVVSHLGHKLTTELRPDGNGVVDAGDGQCTMAPGDGVLVLTAVAETADGMAHIQDVVGRHLQRFGAREGLQVTWEPAATA